MRCGKTRCQRFCHGTSGILFAKNRARVFI
jgi:hypothetical protein